MTSLTRTLLMTLVALMLAAPVQAAVDLMGTWHVLVHYKDKAAGNADAERWEDRIWEFRMEGERLVWVEYPIVVFKDQEGRFDNSMGRLSRVLTFWEPNGAQRRQIRDGLEINNRGSKKKTLRGTPATGWSSAKKRRGYASVSIVTFEETWTIEYDGELPAFIRDDVMGSGGTENMEGRTSYTTTAVEKNGDLIRGTFDRDEGNRSGTFQMRRSGKVASVGNSGKTLLEKRNEERQLEQILAGKINSLPGEHGEAWYRAKVDDGTITESDRYELRAAFEEQLRSALQTEKEVAAFRVMLQNLAVRMERLFVEEGKSLSDIAKMLRAGELRI